jgi:hypothetical protein
MRDPSLAAATPRPPAGMMMAIRDSGDGPPTAVNTALTVITMARSEGSLNSGNRRVHRQLCGKTSRHHHATATADRQ